MRLAPAPRAARALPAEHSRLAANWLPPLSPRLPVSIWHCDLDLRVTEVVYSEHTLDPAQFVGKTDFDWLQPEDAERLAAIKRRCLATQTPIRERIAVTLRGVPHTYDLLVVPDLDSDGKPQGITCMIVDVEETARGSAWQRLRQVSSWLSARREEPATITTAAQVRLGDLIIDSDLHALRGPGGSVHLSRTEWLLLDYFVSNRGRVLGHEELIDRVWGAPYTNEHRLLHDTISRLRHRAHEAGFDEDPIETVHGVGYRLKEAPQRGDRLGCLIAAASLVASLSNVPL